MVRKKLKKKEKQRYFVWWADSTMNKLRERYILFHWAMFKQKQAFRVWMRIIDNRDGQIEVIQTRKDNELLQKAFDWWFHLHIRMPNS